MSNVIVTWMYSSPVEENILYPQVRGSGNKQRVQNYYWRCVFLFFESSTRLNSSSRHLLFLNKEPPAVLDGVDTKRLIKQYNIELIEFPTITKSPPDYHKGWNTQFIVLDMLDFLKDNVKKDDNVFLLDNDIIFNKAIDDNLLNMLQTHKTLPYSLKYADTFLVNGLTNKDLLEIAKDMSCHYTADKFSSIGGEFLCCLGTELSRIAEKGRQAYLVSLERHKKGLKKFNEEGHLLSYVYYFLGYKPYTGNKFIRRIWTDRMLYSDVDGNESDLIFWHLPAEKRNGFVKVFRSYREVNGKYELSNNDFYRAYRIQEAFSEKIFRYLKTIPYFGYSMLRKIINRF